MLTEDRVEVNKVNWRKREQSEQRLVGENTEKGGCDANADRCFIQCLLPFPWDR